MARSKLDARTRTALRGLGAELVASRRAAGLSQGQLAAAIGMGRENYAKIERGQINVTIDSLVRVAHGLGREVVVRMTDRTAKPATRTTRLSVSGATVEVAATRLQSGQAGATSPSLTEALDRAVEALANERGVPRGARRILAASARGVAREDIPQVVGIATSTAKEHVRRLIRRFGEQDLAAVTRRVWRQVLEDEAVRARGLEGATSDIEGPSHTRPARATERANTVAAAKAQAKAILAVLADGGVHARAELLRRARLGEVIGARALETLRRAGKVAVTKRGRVPHYRLAKRSAD